MVNALLVLSCALTLGFAVTLAGVVVARDLSWHNIRDSLVLVVGSLFGLDTIRRAVSYLRKGGELKILGREKDKHK
jgi:hypothetical protein